MMRRSLAVVATSLAALLGGTGCAQLLGADFDGLRPKAQAIGGDAGSDGGASGNGSGGDAGDGGTSDVGGQAGDGGAAAGGSGSGSSSGSAGSAGVGGDPGAGAGGASGGGQAGGGGTTGGAGGSAGVMAGGSAGVMAGGSAGVMAGGSAGTGQPPPPRVCGNVEGLDPQAPWPLDAGCPTRINRATSSVVPLGPGSLPFYSATTGSDEITGPALVDGAGNVYVSTRHNEVGVASKTVIRAFDDKSAGLWSFDIPNEVPTALVLTRFGGVPSILVATNFQTRLLSRDGTTVLGGVPSTGGFLGGSPVVTDNTVIFTNALGELHAWLPDGAETGDVHEVYDGGNTDPALLSPAVGEDGTIYFVKMLGNGKGGFLHAVTMTKDPLKLTKKWSVSFDGYPYAGHLAVAGDGTIVFASGKALLGFTPDGDAAFSVPMTTAESRPAILGDRIFHADAGKGTVRCVATTGKLLYEIDAGYAKSFLITADGLVTFASTSPQKRLSTIVGTTGVSAGGVEIASFSFASAILSVDGKGRPYAPQSTGVLGYGAQP
jgi:hypothetical protein